MEKIGTSSLLTEKYRPQTIADLIVPTSTKSLFIKYITSKDIPNLLFNSTAGRGKTSTAYALCADIGADSMYINGSVETSIDTLRYKVSGFASSNSFNDGKKVVILDECERISPNGQDALKALMEQTEANCRFILTTNNMAKIIDPIKSRCQLVDFNFGATETKPLIIAYFKRICYILDNEKIKYDKAVLAEFTQKMYPDFRRTLNEIQKCRDMHGEISSAIFNNLDGSQFTSLVEEIKNKKFMAVRKIISDMDAESFYQTFYDQIDDLLEPTCMPTVIMILGQYAYESSLSCAKEVTLAACCTALMKESKWL